jgi:hypothetical protein
MFLPFTSIGNDEKMLQTVACPHAHIMTNVEFYTHYLCYFYFVVAAPCKDQIDHCKSLKNNISGFCDGKYKNSYARTNCARSCDRCDQF